MWKSSRKLKQSEVNNADFLIVDNLNISGSDVSNEVYYNNKTITRPKNNTNLNVFIVCEIASVYWGEFIEYFLLHILKWTVQMQGLFVPFACVGSGDPVRVLRLYTMNTLDTLWSIYFQDICTTCRYRIYVLLAQALRLWDFLLLIRTLLKYLVECTLTLHCVVTYICACVDASRTVLWDRSQRRLKENNRNFTTNSHIQG